MCFVSLVVCLCLACVGVIGLLFLCVWVLACGRWFCLVEGCDSVGVSWWAWLFGCGAWLFRGGGLLVWLRGVVASGGVSVGFDVGGRVFTLGGVSAPASGSSPAVSGSVSVSGSVVPVSPDAGVGASGSSGGVGGVWVCVPCAVRVFGESWCSLVLRRWARAAGVDVAKVGMLLGFGPGSVQSVVSGSALSLRVSVVSSGLFSSSPSPVSGGSASLRSASAGGGRDWGGVWCACA